MIGFAFFGAGMGAWGMFHIWDTDINHVIAPFINPVNLSLIGITGILIILIPVLAIIYGLFKALFRFKAKDKALGMGAFALWLIALLTVITLGANEIKNYKAEEEVITTIPLSDINSDTLYLSMNDVEEDLFEDKEEFRFDDRRYVVGSDEKIYGRVNVDLRESETDYFEFEIEKSSRGADYYEAMDYAKNIDYDFKVEGNRLIMDQYFYSEYDNKWRLQMVELTIYVPDGKAIKFDQEVADHIDYVRTDSHYSPWKMADKVWIMKDSKFGR